MHTLYTTHNPNGLLLQWPSMSLFLWGSLSFQQRETVSQIDSEPCLSAPDHSATVTEVEMAEPGPSTPAMPLESSSTGLASPTTSPLQPSLTGPADDPNPIEQIAEFDAHFHPDRLQMAASGQSRKQDGGHAMVPGREPDHLFPITGGTLNYCDPDFFSRPSFEENHRGQDGWVPWSRRRGGKWSVRRH